MREVGRKCSTTFFFPELFFFLLSDSLTFKEPLSAVSFSPPSVERPKMTERADPTGAAGPPLRRVLADSNAGAAPRTGAPTKSDAVVTVDNSAYQGMRRRVEECKLDPASVMDGPAPQSPKVGAHGALHWVMRAFPCWRVGHCLIQFPLPSVSPGSASPPRYLHAVLGRLSRCHCSGRIPHVDGGHVPTVFASELAERWRGARHVHAPRDRQSHESRVRVRCAAYDC